MTASPASAPSVSEVAESSIGAARTSERTKPGEATFIVFSGDLDRLLAAFTMANTAAASGMRTTIFFTFWGLSAVRRDSRSGGGGVVDRLFKAMLPRGPRSLPTSRLNLFGLGPRLFRWRMAKKRQPDLETLIEHARALGVRLVVCEASADVLGLRRDDLQDGIEVAGAMTCLRDAAASDVALFI